MKKLISLLILVALVFSLAACGQKNETIGDVAKEENQSSFLAGGWSRSASPVITDEVKILLNKATDQMTGATYTPVAYLGSQVVAGTNHAILCRVAPVVPDPVENYVIVFLHEDLNGNVQITETLESNRSTDINDLDGGWTQAESPVLTENVWAVLEKALDGSVGAGYTPLALLSTQVVAGTNYCILCEITPVVPDAKIHFALVYVYEDVAGNAEITETVDFEQ